MVNESIRQKNLLTCNFGFSLQHACLDGLALTVTAIEPIMTVSPGLTLNVNATTEIPN